MAFPNDTVLPTDAKIHGFIDTKYPYNSHWDIVWSFAFALTGIEHAFSTFLTDTPTITSNLSGGQYLGYLNPQYIPSDYILSESGDYLLTEDNNYITTGTNIPNAGVFAVAFDSTGYFALSYDNHSGVGINDIKKNALIIRNNDEVIFNESLSSLSTEFFLSSSIKNYQTLRFRFSNAGKKFYIDYKSQNSEYINLTSINMEFDNCKYPILYPAFTFCSPISSLTTPSTIYLKNFHTQGNIQEPTYERLEFIPLTSTIPSGYTTLSGISASP